MGSKIFWFCIFVAMCVGGYFIYDHIHQEKLMTNGDVTCIGCMSPEASARFAKENSGETADGQSEHKIRTAREENAAGNPEGAVAAGQVAPQPAAAPTAAQTAPAPVVAAAPVPTPAAQPAMAARTYTTSTGPAPASLPARDSIAPNPSNEVRFSGTGNYQWYRQGNLTWRVDTVSGRSCIDYATLEEWRKQIVSSHGCGRGA